VERYFTLSLASFNLSVNKRSNLLYSMINLLIFSSPLFVDLSCCLFLCKVVLTVTKSLPFNYSDQLVISCIRVFQ
jgi:Na+/H+ antiporter NhaD/arsenite permease-like protein